VSGGDGGGLRGTRLEEIYSMVHKVSLDFPLSLFSLRAFFNFYSSSDIRANQAIQVSHKHR